MTPPALQKTFWKKLGAGCLAGSRARPAPSHSDAIGRAGAGPRGQIPGCVGDGATAKMSAGSPHAPGKAQLSLERQPGCGPGWNRAPCVCVCARRAAPAARTQRPARRPHKAPLVWAAPAHNAALAGGKQHPGALPGISPPFQRCSQSLHLCKKKIDVVLFIDLFANFSLESCSAEGCPGPMGVSGMGRAGTGLGHCKEQLWDGSCGHVCGGPSWCHAARSMAWGLGWRSWPLCQLEGGLGCPRGGFGWPERALDGEEVASGVQEMVSGGCRVVLGGWEVTGMSRRWSLVVWGLRRCFFGWPRGGPLPAGPAPVRPHCRAPTGNTGTGVPGGGDTWGGDITHAVPHPVPSPLPPQRLAGASSPG